MKIVIGIDKLSDEQVKNTCTYLDEVGIWYEVVP